MHAAVSKLLPRDAWLLRKWAVLILGALCGLLATCRKPEVPLRVRVAGCPILWAQPSHLVCAARVLGDQRLLFYVEGPPLARLRYQVGDARPEETRLSAAGRATVRATIPKVAARATLRAESADGAAEYTLEMQPSPFVTAYRLRDKLDCGQRAKLCLDSAHELLRRLDAGQVALAAPERAFLLGSVGVKLGAVADPAASAEEVAALDELALSVHERAMAEAHQTGLLSVEAVALERWGDVRSKQPGAYDRNQLVARLRDPVHKLAVEQTPDVAAAVSYTLSWVEMEWGNLAAAKTLAGEAAAVAEAFELEPRFRLQMRLHEALAAQSLNQTCEAERITSQVEAQLNARFLDDPCQVARKYNALAYIKLVSRQGGHAAADPDAPFDKAADFLSRCERLSESREAAEEGGVLATNRALYALIRAEQAASGGGERLQQLDRAEAMLRQARGAQERAGRLDELVVKQDLAYLAARIALLRGQADEALRGFLELEQLTRQWLSPHYRWASQIGQADAHLLRGELAEARTCYAGVEALLDLMATKLPMTTGHQLFLSQFEGGTGRYLKLLLAEPGAEAQVLEVIRHARVRALRTYARWAGVPGSQREVQLYATRLGTREATQAELLGAPVVEQEKLTRHLEQIESEQAELLEALYHRDAADHARLELRPPAAGELAIACYPLPAEPAAPPAWVCAAGTRLATQVLRIDAPSAAAPERAAQAILAGFGKLLGQVQHLRILPYGPLRLVAWASLPWAGGRLGEQLTIRYGVDLPSAGGSAAPAAQRALLVTNPQQDLVGAERAGRQLRRELLAAGWQLDARAGAPRRGGHMLTLLARLGRGQEPPPALATEVAHSLPSADLFIFYGHAESLGPGGWDSRLRFAEDGSISARDVMSLPAVPRKVLLIGCETAVSDREAPADEAGVAQAFILRGSKEVLATTRKVADKTAEALIDKLAQLGALRPDGPPLAAALREAVSALRTRHPAADLDAFRVYAP